MPYSDDHITDYDHCVSVYKARGNSQYMAEYYCMVAGFEPYYEENGDGNGGGYGGGNGNDFNVTSTKNLGLILVGLLGIFVLFPFINKFTK